MNVIGRVSLEPFYTINNQKKYRRRQKLYFEENFHPRFQNSKQQTRCLVSLKSETRIKT